MQQEARQFVMPGKLGIFGGCGCVKLDQLLYPPHRSVTHFSRIDYVQIKSISFFSSVILGRNACII
jgi:hypothetical protein